jgi:homoserine dehydrogenase
MVKKSVYHLHKRLLDESNTDFEHWYKALEAELGVLQDQGSFGEAKQYGRVMKSKFVFITSFKQDFTVKYKARLVVCEYSQVSGVDYEETVAPTTPIMNIILHITNRYSEESSESIV